MLLIQFSHLFTSFGPLSLFEDISFSVSEGDLIALIGENGAGKTTLLKLLAGEMQWTRGDFSRKSGLSVGFVPQETILSDPSISLRKFIEGESLSDLEKEMADCLEGPDRLIEWANLHEQYEMLGGYQRIPMEEVLRGLKLELPNLPMSSLSSGQRMRASLAKALIANPDLLLLDEPTNHLDQEMTQWLKMTLKQRKGASVIVSHDTHFIKPISNHLI